jgi:hypothetical protein
MALDKTKLAAIFKKAQQTAKKSVSSEGTAKKFDDRFLKLNIGSSYQLRLLYLPTKERQVPFIEHQVHRNYDAATKTYTKVVCPTSSHISGVAGFDECPVCRAMSDLWKRAQNGDTVAGEIYKNCRRSAENYAVVYVAKDSSTENPQTGKIKILKYGFEIANFLNSECLGIAGKGQPEIDPDEIVGFEAFDLEAGRNLIIKVGKKDVRMNGKTVSFPAYETSFSRSLTSIPVDIDDLPKIFEELRFDQDFFVNSNSDELLSFYKKFVAAEAEEATVNEFVEEDEEDDIPMDYPSPKKSTKSMTDLLEEDEDEEPEEDEVDEDEDEDEEFPAPKKSSAAKKANIDSLDLDDLLADFDD